MAIPVPSIDQGFKFPFQFSSETGGVEMVNATTYDGAKQLIRESILQIIGTELGERFMRRNFGSAIYSLVFKPQNSEFDMLLIEATEGALRRWENRIFIKNVQIKRLPDFRELVIIEIEYIIIKTRISDIVRVPYFPNATS